MSYVNQQFKTGHETSTVLAFFFANVIDRLKRIDPLILVWWCLALSIVSSCITRFTTESSGVAYYVLLIAGSGGCAWVWLLSRIMFGNKQDLNPGAFMLVFMVMAIEAIHLMIPDASTAGSFNEIIRVFNNAASMVCITFIAFVCYETLNGYSTVRSVAERRFRIAFLVFFSLIVLIAILWVSGASAGSFAGEWSSAILNLCAITSLIGTRIAVQYRLSTLPRKTKHLERSQFTSSENTDSELLARRILNAINDDALLTTTNLKVSEFADQIGEQEYKVTRCITNRLQYRNFNHLLNSHRIDRAKRIFNDPDSRHLTIATIAFDCGFNSLGPFNRAFRQYTGMTPREFRQKQLSD